MGKIKDSLDPEVISMLKAKYGDWIGNMFSMSALSEIVSNYNLLDTGERRRMMEKLWNGDVRSNGSNMIKRTFHCYTTPDIRPEVTVTTWSDNGTVRAYVWKLDSHFDKYKLIGGANLERAGRSEEEVMEEIYAAARKQAFGHGRGRYCTKGKDIEMLPYGDMLW
jgi:hypothetical protein